MKVLGFFCIIVGVMIVIVTFARVNSPASTRHDGPVFDVPTSQAKNMVISYYDNQSQWAGQYVISTIKSISFQSSSDSVVTACVVYDYTPLSSNNGASPGTDRRVFEFDYTSTGWQVVSLYDYASC